MTREIKIANEGRANGNYSIYVREGSFWNYTGLTFGSARECASVVAAIRRNWCGSGARR